MYRTLSWADNVYTDYVICDDTVGKKFTKCDSTKNYCTCPL